MNRTLHLLVFACVLALIAGCAMAGPYRSSVHVSGDQPYAQWFEDANTGALDDAHFEFYDNLCAPGFPDYPWGGLAGTPAISGVVTSIRRVPSGSIVAFDMAISVTNDTYTWLWGMNGTSGSGYWQGAPDIAAALETSMYNVRVSLDFADAGLPGYTWAQIYALDYEDLAWYGYSSVQRPEPGGDYYGYVVPTFRFGNIAPMQTVTRTVSCGLWAPVFPEDPLYTLLVASKEQSIDLLANRTSSLKVAQYPVGLFEDSGASWPNPSSYNGNASVFFDVQPAYGAAYIDIGPNTPANHYWWQNKPGSTPNEMIQIAVTAGPDEDARLDTMQLSAYGSGNDQTDIDAVEAYLDADGDGRVGPGDPLVGTGKYDADGGICQFAFSQSATVPASGTIYLVIAYRMAPEAAYWGDFAFQVTRTRVSGVTSGSMLPVYSGNLTSCTKTVIQEPVVVNIGQAKQLESGRTVIIRDKPITWQASSWNAWIEEPDRSAGIRVDGLDDYDDPPPPPPMASESGVRLATVLGVIELDGYGFEALIRALESKTTVNPAGVLPAPVAMSNKSIGGGAFGIQPAVVDDASVDPPRMATGTNNVGLLARTCGRVKYLDPYYMDIWIDDGSNLFQGFLDYDTQEPVRGLCVRMPSDWPWEERPPVGTYLAVTGIVRTSYNYSWLPVRWLFPRDANDVTIIARPEGM